MRLAKAVTLTALLVALIGADLNALPAPIFELPFSGIEFPVDYARYGKFSNIGSEQYKYEITDSSGLALAVGAGIYPNYDLSASPRFKRFESSRSPKASPWDYLNKNPEEAFYAWSMASDMDEGVKLFYVAENLRRAGLVKPAIKAYYAAVIHFPRSVAWNSDGAFYWYIAPEAISRIRRLCAEHPDLGIQLENALVDVVRAPGKNPGKDHVKVWPGTFRKKHVSLKSLRTQRVIESRGNGRVRAVKFQNGHWQLRVDGRPFIVKGVTYDNTKIGESPHVGTLRPWMTVDDNHNGLNDGMFDSWVDINRNNIQDPNEFVIGDAQLLKTAGFNAIRVYHGQRPGGGYDPAGYNKGLMRQLNEDYGIFFVMGDFFGAYTIGSGADWDKGTDYTDPDQREKMRRSVEDMVRDHKNEPYVLMWLLGNENQHPHTRTNADKKPQEYARFVNEIAEMIHRIDPDHPVAVGNLGYEGLKELAKEAPAVDIYGANSYAGEYSMGSVVQQTKFFYDRPLMFTEWGCDAYAQGVGPDEEAQADYIRGNWIDMKIHMAGRRGEGNVIGGIVFEWMDEWWKSGRDTGSNPQWRQSTVGDMVFPYRDGWAHEEWYGLVGQGDGKHSPYMRQLRQAYFKLREIWSGTIESANS